MFVALIVTTPDADTHAITPTICGCDTGSPTDTLDPVVAPDRLTVESAKAPGDSEPNVTVAVVVSILEIVEPPPMVMVSSVADVEADSVVNAPELGVTPPMGVLLMELKLTSPSGGVSDGGVWKSATTLPMVVGVEVTQSR